MLTSFIITYQIFSFLMQITLMIILQISKQASLGFTLKPLLVAMRKVRTTPKERPMTPILSASTWQWSWSSWKADWPNKINRDISREWQKHYNKYKAVRIRFKLLWNMNRQHSLCVVVQVSLCAPCKQQKDSQNPWRQKVQSGTPTVLHPLPTDPA